MNGELQDEVYVTQPERFEKKGQEDRVYKLNKALYGLCQAPRAWNLKLDSTLKDIGFSKCRKEPSVYLKKVKTDLLVLAIYVDDLFVIGTSLQAIKQFKDDMARRFEMLILGSCHITWG